MPARGRPNGGHPVPAWGSFAISVLLVGVAAEQLVARQSQAIAGAVLGYVAAFWLPARHPAPSAEPPSAGG